MADTNRSSYLLTSSNAPTQKDLANIVYDIQAINYLVATATFTFTQVNACDITPLIIATPSVPSKTILPIAFFYTQALEGGDSFGVDFFITMDNGGTITSSITADTSTDLSCSMLFKSLAAISDNAYETGESFKLTSTGPGAGTAGTVTITTVYIEI